MYRILCIDEVDKLFSTERTIVYDLFEWPYTSSQLLIVIGIANSIDLIEKSLPLLKAGSRCFLSFSLSPTPYLKITTLEKTTETMVFPSYSVTALKEIVQQRIALCNESLGTTLSLFQPAAIELCCKKVVCGESMFIIL